MYTRKEVNQIVEAFVNKHIEDTKIHALKHHVLHESDFISLCENNAFPKIEESYQETLKEKMNELKQTYVSRQKSQDNSDRLDLKDKLRDLNRTLRRHQDDQRQFEQNILSINGQILENASRRTEAEVRYNSQHPANDSHHHGRDNQSDEHHHGRETNSSPHQHDRRTGPDLSKFNQIEEQLKSNLRIEQQKQQTAIQSIFKVQGQIRDLESSVRVIEQREKNYSRDESLYDYLNTTHKKDYSAACQKEGSRLEEQKDELKQQVKTFCHGMFLTKLRTYLIEKSKSDSLDDQESHLKELVDELFDRKESLIKLNNQLKEMRSSHQSEQQTQQKVVQKASSLHREQLLKRNRLENGIRDNKQFLENIPNQIRQLREENENLNRDEEGLKSDLGKFQQEASQAKSSYEKATKIANPILYTGAALAAVGVIGLLIFSIPWLVTTSLSVLAVGGLSAVVAEGVKLGYSFNASGKQKALDGHNSQISGKQDAQQENDLKINELQRKEKTLPATIEQDKETLSREDQLLEKYRVSLEKEQQQYKQLAAEHKRDERELEKGIRELREKPFEEGVKVRDLSFFSASPTVVSITPTNTLGY